MELKNTINYYLKEFNITSAFGERRGNTSHLGVDLNQPGDQDLGKPIYSLTAGTVKRIGYENNGAGHLIVIGDGGNETKYFHMQEKTKLSAGAIVEVGDLLGLIGSTGNSTGPHLHLERWENKKAIDPILWMTQMLANTTNTKTGTFKDVAIDAWYFTAIEKANKLGLMVGKTKDTFGPHDTATRAEIAVVIVRLYEQLLEKGK